MAANEIKNALRAQLRLSATNPPVLLASNGVKVDTLARIGAGHYSIELSEPLQGDHLLDNVTLHCSNSIDSAASFSGVQLAALAGGAGLVIFTRILAGTLADTAVDVSVLVLDTPTRT